jgi:hypothetical protein
MSNNLAEPVSLGMKLDAMLQQVDSLSSTTLYAVIVGFTVVISFLLLGSGVQDVPQLSSSPTLKKASFASQGPQPKWFVLRWLNYAAIVGFCVSVLSFAMNAQTYMKDSSVMFRFLIGWSLFLCYFFAFFGISFVDADDLMEG